MERLRTLKKISNYLKFGWIFWVIGIVSIVLGMLFILLFPNIINRTIIIDSGNLNDSVANLNEKEKIIEILSYIGYSLCSIGVMLCIFIGSSFSGYAVFEAIKLKNDDKKNERNDYTLMCAISCFLLPFFFLSYAKNSVDKEIRYLKKMNVNLDEEKDILVEEYNNSYRDIDKQLSLNQNNDLLKNELINQKVENPKKESNDFKVLSEEEWLKMSYSQKVEYVDKLLDKKIISEKEHKFLLNNIEKESFKDTLSDLDKDQNSNKESEIEIDSSLIRKTLNLDSLEKEIEEKGLIE